MYCDSKQRFKITRKIKQIIKESLFSFFFKIKRKITLQNHPLPPIYSYMYIFFLHSNIQQQHQHKIYKKLIFFFCISLRQKFFKIHHVHDDFFLFIELIYIVLLVFSRNFCFFLLIFKGTTNTTTQLYNIYTYKRFLI